MRAGPHGGRPLAPPRVGEVGGKLLFELGHERVLGVLGPQPISCVYQALCLIGEGGEMVADEAGGDMVFGGFQEDTPETGLSTSTGGGRRFPAKLQLGLLEEPVPACPPEVGVNVVGVFGGFREPVSQPDQDWEVVGVEGGEWGPGVVEGKVGAGYCEVGGGAGAIVG